MKRLAASAIAFALCLSGMTGAAGAHPHVFAEARLEVAIGPDGMVETMRHVWRFDDLFSSTVLLEFDEDTDNRLEEPELENVASVVTESLTEFNFFQTILVGGKDVPVEPVTDLKALYDDGQLTIFFTSVPTKPIDVRSSPSFGVYDPTFYTAIDFTDESQMVLEGAPANCTRKMVVPDPDEALAQNQATLTDAFFNDPAGTNWSKLLATRMEVTCE